MEHISATDLLRLDQELYQQEVKNKAFTSYCLALKCGVDQVDAFPQNYLLDKDGKMTMIDFGLAKRVSATTKRLIEYAEESGEYDALIEHLRTINPKLNRWLLSDKSRFVTITPLPSEVISRCLTGLCKSEESWCSIMGGRRTKKKRKKLKRLSVRY
jgi:serine/threonine protein kinase